MMSGSLSDLRISDRLEILFKLLKNEKISPIIDELDNRSVSGLQQFVWEKTVEFGIICRGKHFDRKEITRRMTPTPNYQRQQGCSEKSYYCKGSQCIFSNPVCARKKIKEHVDVMAESVQEYIKIVWKKDNQ